MVFVSIMTLFALGLAASIILAVASRVFYVKEDPRVEAVVEALPGANCGGCGFAGCEGYATAVVNDPSVPANKCCAGGAATSIAVGELTGKTVAEATGIAVTEEGNAGDADLAASVTIGIGEFQTLIEKAAV